jgi:hypothetical protein
MVNVNGIEDDMNLMYPTIKAWGHQSNGLSTNENSKA